MSIDPARPLTRREARERRAQESRANTLDALGSAPAESGSDAEVVDAFAAALKVLGSVRTGEVATLPDASSEVPRVTNRGTTVGEREGDGTRAGLLSRGQRRRGRAMRKVAAVGATLGIMAMAGLLAVSTTLSAQSVAAVQSGGGSPLDASGPAGASDQKVPVDEIQAYVSSADVVPAQVERASDYTAVSHSRLAADAGILRTSSAVFTNDPLAAIQWPFAVGVPMTWGYGMRDGRMHQGLDLVPGEGSAVQAIADGVVRTATEQGGAFGVLVIIDSTIDGKVVTSLYGHMQRGSLRVQEGHEVKVGEVIGQVGNTGRSFGAHLHFEIHVDGVTIDPLPWLNENAGRMTLD